MKSKLLVAVFMIGTAVVTILVAYRIHFGGKVVVADRRADVFNTEYAAAYEGALNRVPALPIASIESGEHVAVVWDTYGKVYWACYVRTSKGVRRWALCTSLRIVS